MSQQQPDPARPRFRGVTTLIKTLFSVAPKRRDPLPARPALDDLEGWKTYWQGSGQPWRIEPEIDTQRQTELAKRCAIVPDVEKGIYPFSGMKLSRADIEWLLATHENGRGPVEWSDLGQHERKGLDLRGVDLCGSEDQPMNLTGLPLTKLIGGLNLTEWWKKSEKQQKLASMMLNRTDFRESQFQWGNLRKAQLERANLHKAQLEGANLSEARLEKANLSEAQLKFAQLRRADLRGAQLQKANLQHAQLQKANLQHAQLQKASLFHADLQEAGLSGAQLQGADLCGARLQGADFRKARLQGANLSDVVLADPEGVGPQLADIQWDGTNLSVVDWSPIKILGDEYIAQQKKNQSGLKRYKEEHLGEYLEALRANRQLAVALQSQGLNEEAAYFAYRANMLQRKVLWFQMRLSGVSFGQRLQKLGAWAFSHLLNVLAGYGYRPGRSFLAYLLIVFGFMGFYLITSQFVAPHLNWDEALVLSLSSFHGRGFFTQTLTLGDPYARLAVAEAVLGLFVEVSLIATFTQRFFAK